MVDALDTGVDHTVDVRGLMGLAIGVSAIDTVWAWMPPIVAQATWRSVGSAGKTHADIECVGQLFHDPNCTTPWDLRTW